MQTENNNMLLNRASEYAELGQLDKARQLILQAIQNDSKDVEAWWALAHLAQNDNERHKAVREVLRLEPDHLHALHMRDQLRAGSLESLDHPGQLAERKMDAIDDDFHGKAIVTLIAYLAFSIVGLVLNVYFLYQAKRFQNQYGYVAKNVGCLWAMLCTFVILPLTIAVLLFGFGFLSRY